MRCALLVAIVMLFSATALARKWTDNTGGFSVDAEFRGVEDDAVVLEKRNRKTIRVPLAKLSPRDQSYVWARRTLRTLAAAAAMENVSTLAEAAGKAAAELFKEGAADQAETGVKRELAQAERRKQVEAVMRKVCEGFQGKPFTIVFPITDVRRAKYVPNVPRVMPGGGIIFGPRWIPAGPDDYELLVGPPKGWFATELKAPGLLNVKLSQDQVLGIGRESLWIASGVARLEAGEARVVEGRLVVERGPAPVAAIAVSAKGRTPVSGGILIHLDNERNELKHGAAQEKAAGAKKPATPSKKKK